MKWSLSIASELSAQTHLGIHYCSEERRFSCNSTDVWAHDTAQWDMARRVDVRSSKRIAEEQTHSEGYDTLQTKRKILEKHFATETPWTGYMSVKTEDHPKAPFQPAVVAIGKQRIEWIQPHHSDQVFTIFLGGATTIDHTSVPSQFGRNGMANIYNITSFTSLTYRGVMIRPPILSTTIFLQDVHRKRTPREDVCTNWMLNSYLAAKSASHEDPVLEDFLVKAESSKYLLQGEAVPSVMTPESSELQELRGWNDDDHSDLIFGASVGHLVLGLEYMSDGVPPELDVLIVEYSMAVSGFRLLTHRHYIEHRTSMLAESVQLIVEGLFESGWPLVFTNIEKTQDIIRQMIESGEAPPSYSRLP